jgi:hypothetical protein
VDDTTLTTDDRPDIGDTFDRLLEAMPRIAEAVNAFSSEKNQRAALDALVRAIGIGPFFEGVAAPAVAAAPAAVSTTPLSDSGSYSAASVIEEPVTVNGSEPVTAPKTTARRRRPGRKWEPVRNIDFYPEGKQSLPELAEEKQPTNADQRNLLAVWWLEQVAEMKNIGVGQVLAAYKACGWREPASPDNALQVTASRQSWIDTKDMTAIETTPQGRNLVQHQLPNKKAGK